MEAENDYKWTVYGIRCALTGDIRYIGVTCNLKSRRRDHRRESRSGSKLRVHKWLKSMEDDGWPAEFVELESGIGYETAADAERRWIETHRPAGRLFNVKDGGEFAKTLDAYKAARSDEAKQLGRAAGMRGAHGQQFKEGMAEKRPVFCVQTGESWVSMGALAKALGLPDERRVSQSCKKGFALLGRHYMFVSDELYPEGRPRLTRVQAPRNERLHELREAVQGRDVAARHAHPFAELEDPGRSSFPHICTAGGPQ